MTRTKLYLLAWAIVLAGAVTLHWITQWNH